MATTSASFARFSVISRPSSSNPQFILFNAAPRTGTPHSRTGSARFRCLAGQTGFFTKLGRLIKEKAKSDVEKLFSGFSKTRSNLAVIDELLLYWNLADTDRVLDELEEVPSCSFLNSWVFILFYLEFNFRTLKLWRESFAAHGGPHSNMIVSGGRYMWFKQIKIILTN